MPDSLPDETVVAIQATPSEESRNILRLLVDNSPTSVLLLDRQFRLLMASRTFMNDIERTEGDIIGHTIYEILPDAVNWRERHLKALSGEIIEVPEYCIESETKGDRWYRVQINPWHKSNGTIIGIMVFFEDITEQVESRKSMERFTSQLEMHAFERTADLEAAKERLTLATQTAQMGIWEYSFRSHHLTWNDQMHNLFDLPADEWDGSLQAWSERIHAKDRDKLAEPTLKRLAQDEIWTGEIRAEHRDGQILYLKCTVQGFTDEDNNPHRVIGTTFNITDKVLQNQALTRAKETAEQASLAKTRFLANMSHEIRTPMNAVIGFSELLERSPLNAQQLANVQRLKGAGKTLLGIINDVLDLAKIEAGELELSEEPVDMQELLDNIGNVFGVTAEEKGLCLKIDPLPEGTPQHYLADPTRISQILVNLVGNALKFTEQGCVCLSVQEIASQSDQTRLRLRIADTGIGMAPELLPKLFKPFVQADSSNIRRFGGTGLGLSIVRELAEQMGGSASVSSEINKGTVFTIELELQALAQAASPDVEPIDLSDDDTERLANIHILLVDDTDINVVMAEQMLLLEGASVACCYNGQEALDYLNEHWQQTDIVLMDVQMPVMDGNTAVRNIRANPHTRNLPVVALTASALLSEREVSMQAGMSDYLTKPFDHEKMVEIIRAQVRAYRHAQKATASNA